MLDQFVIPARFRGPSGSGNGGWTSGHLAAALGVGPGGPAVTVKLLSPPPLERGLDIRQSDDAFELWDADTRVAVAAATPAPEAPRQPVPFADAVAARHRYAGLVDHPFPECFACGIARDSADALCLATGEVPGSAGTFAAAWVPREVTLEIVWAALDCPGAWAIDLAGRALVLGTMTTRVVALPEAGQDCVVVAWATASEGRKHRSGTALYAGEHLLAHASAVWITVDPASIRPAAP